VTRFRIATFNLENLGSRLADETVVAARTAALRPQLLRLDADILCLQEVNPQPSASHEERALAALDRLVEGTRYAGYRRIATESASGKRLADRHNLVILSRFPVARQRQVRHELLPPLLYSPVTATAENGGPIENHFDRPFQYVAATLPDGRTLHVMNLHLKAPIAVPIPGQKVSALVWRSIAGWAEGFYLAAIKRSGQALEVRLMVEKLLDADPQALIAVCGDCNAEAREVPVRIMMGSEDDTGNPALGGRVLVPLDDSVPAERRYSVLHARRPVMLDHILVSPRLAAAHAGTEILNVGLKDEILDAKPESQLCESFHAPMVAGFELPD
jgi:endonuclease/exonuclease/phosphatase family metal-dependent hydrolase